LTIFTSGENILARPVGQTAQRNEIIILLDAARPERVHIIPQQVEMRAIGVALMPWVVVFDLFLMVRLIAMASIYTITMVKV
jgi:hypothetical protein